MLPIRFQNLLRAVLAAMLSLGAVQAGVAQVASPNPGDFSIDTWQVEDGLPDNRVSSVAQTADGYMWFGTYAGLVRFDGVKFTVFDSSTPGLASGRIASLFADRAGGLWVGMEYGDLARYAGGRFTAFGLAQGWQNRMAVCFVEELSGDLLIGTAGGGVTRFKDQKFTRLLDDAAVEIRTRSQFSGPMNLAFDSRDSASLWARTADGLQIFQRGEWRSRPLPDGTTQTELTAIISAGGGGVWVCAGGTLQLLQGDAAPIVRGVVPRRLEAGITSMMEDSSSNVWLSTWGRGLFRYAPDGSAQSFTENERVPSFLRRVFEDREGNIWIGTSGDGVLRLKPRVFRSFAPEPPAPSYRLNVLAANPEGGLWIGTDAHGLVEWNNGSFSDPIVLAGLPPERPVWALAVEPAGRVWLGSYSDGVFVLDGTNSFQRHVSDGLVNNRVYALEVARDGSVWVGTDNGVSRYHNDTFENFTSKNGLPVGAVRTIAQGTAGDVWFGISGNGGLARWHEGRFNVFKRAEGLAHNSIGCLHADTDGTLWIGTTGGGLSRWREGRFTNFRVEDGLPNGKIVAILDDGLGHLWLGSAHGVFRIARAHLEDFAHGKIARLDCTRYLRGDGLASVQCSEGAPSAVRTSDGRLWFVTQKGLSVVNPRELRTNSVPPPVLIEVVLIDGKSSSLPMANTALNVPAGSRRVEIHYAGLSFAAPERVRFRQRLEGFDNAWQDVGGQRVATFQGLRPGSYHFRVIAANNDGVWNSAGASLAFTIRPEVWQTAWFRATSLLALAGVVFAFVWARIARLQRQQAAQREFSRGLIESQEQERKRISAELHDSLGQNLLVIKNRVTMAKSTGADPQAELDEIAKLATQSIEEVREISQNLRPYQLDRLGLTKALHGLVKKVGASAKVNCVADITPLDRVFPPDAETNLFRIVQEALNNVLKHSGASEAQVVVRREEKHVSLLIEDNGSGFEWPSKYGEAVHGMGLSGIAERVRILDGHLEIESAPGQGARLKIEVPVPGGKS